MAAFEQALYRVQKGCCFNCGQPMPPPRKNGQLPSSVNREHVMPRALGGAKGYPNLALSHLTCNRIKDDQPPTPDQLARLAAINAQLTREDLVAATAEEIELLHNPRIVDRLPGAGRIRSRAVEFLASTLPELSRDELIEAFKSGGAYGQAVLPVSGSTTMSTVNPSSSSQTMAPPAARVFAPDPLDFHTGEVETPTVARPKLLLALAGVVGLAASAVLAAPMLGYLRDTGLSRVQAIWIAPALVAAALAVGFAGRRSTGVKRFAVLLLIAGVVAALGITQIDPQARAIFNDMMGANDLAFRLASYASPMALGALALSALAWVGVILSSLTARAPLES